MVDSAMFYLIGTLYPLIARATYPALGFPQYPGEVGSSDADDELKAKAQADAEAAIAGPARGLPHVLPRRAARSSVATTPSIADIRLAASLEFLRAIDYEFPPWAEGYMTAIEETLGDAYSEPAADVRGYIAYVKSQA